MAVAQVQFEMGRFRRAAMLFDSLANVAWRFSPAFPGDAPGLLARHRIWMTTHIATALAAGGDTASLVPLADRLAAWEGKSELFRDPVLDHYVRVLAARRNADPSFGLRAEWIRRRVHALIRALFVAKREA